MNYFLVMLFNAGFAIFAAFVTSLIFNFKGISTNKKTIRKDSRKMLVRVATATFISACFWMFFFTHKSGVEFPVGLMFGMTSALLTLLFIYIGDKWAEIKYRPGPELVIDSRLQFVRAVLKSMSLMEFFIVGCFVMLYGFISLTIPGLGILWSYLMTHLFF
jgi:hypothetical protein